MKMGFKATSEIQENPDGSISWWRIEGGNEHYDRFVPLPGVSIQDAIFAIVSNRDTSLVTPVEEE